MQPILLLVIAGVGVAALGTGFLGNTINLSMVQDFGVGETNIASPVDNAYIDFKIEKVMGSGIDSDKKPISVFKNVVTECQIQADKTIPNKSTLICKLTDINDNVIIEGSKELVTHLHKDTGTVIQIVDPDLKAKVTEVHDVILVVQGPGSVNP